MKGCKIYLFASVVLCAAILAVAVVYAEPLAMPITGTPKPMPDVQKAVTPFPVGSYSEKEAGGVGNGSSEPFALPSKGHQKSATPQPSIASAGSTGTSSSGEVMTSQMAPDSDSLKSIPQDSNGNGNPTVPSEVPGEVPQQVGGVVSGGSALSAGSAEPKASRSPSGKESPPSSQGKPNALVRIARFFKKLFS